jgi:hypothetical protein
MTMKRIFLSVLFILSLLTTACKKEEIDTSPQIADINSVGCLIANDFYAVHFSAYLKPTNPSKEKDRQALLTPYCQDLPDIGKAFFAADLIDRDIRQTPIHIRIAEIEKTGKNSETFKELRLLKEIEPKVYEKGVIEAQADLDKKGDYAITLFIGDDAISEEDKLKILLHVGDMPLKLSKTMKIILSASMLVLLMILGYFYLFRKKPLED